MKTKTYKPRKLSEVSMRRTDDKAHLSTVKGLPDDFESENHELLTYWRNLWDSLGDFRERYRRAARYHRGDQWGDYMWDPDSKEWLREEDYIRSQGRVPLKQNIIRQLIKNLQGQYRRNPTRTMVYARDREDAALSEMMTAAIQNVHDTNHLSQLEAALMVEFAICGMAISKQVYRFLPTEDTEDVFIKNVNPDRVFFNGDIEDVRMTDLRVVGEILDMPMADVISTFARTKDDEAKIKRWYSAAYYKDFVTTHRALGADMEAVLDFYVPKNPNMCRVIEAWYKRGEWRTWVHDYYDGTYTVTTGTLDDVERQNQERIAEFEQMGIPAEEVPLKEAERRYDQYWYVKYLTPYGHTLHEGETPYDHKEHPYEVTIYPFIRGEVWGLVEDIIDQQRYVNRLITQADFIRGASAKGLLLVHEDSIPDGMDLNDFADEWSRVGGVVKFKGKPGVPMPQQVAANAIPAGLQEMLTMQLKLTYDIMGIHQAAQGQRPPGGTPASLYAMEADLAATNVKDFFETFNYYKQRRDRKVMMLIRQYYNDKRIMHITGSNYAPEAKVYDPQLARDVNYELKVTQGPDTPVYRQVIEDILSNLLSNQFIDIQMYLEHSTMPFADKLLQSIKRRQQEAEHQQGPGGGDAELMEQLGAASQQQQQQHPGAANLLNQM